MALQWSILFDSSGKTPRIHARTPATNFRTERGLAIAAVAGSAVWCCVAGALALVAGLNYATIRFSWRQPLRAIAMLGMRYSCDTAFVWGALLGGLRQGALFLEATRTR
jgi:hypothetical protein